MHPDSTSTERYLLKFIFAAFVLVVLGVAGIWAGSHFFRQWQSDRMAQRANTYFGWGDLKSAALSARRAFQLNNNNLEACRLLAKVAEHENQPSAIEWRQAAVAVAPKSTEDLISLAKTALQFGKISTAENALDQIPDETKRTTPSFYEVKGQIAVASKDAVAAQKYFDEASRLDPTNRAYQLNVAVFQLQSTSAEIRAAAVKVLQAEMEDKEFRVPAARALRDYAAQRKDGPALLGITEYLYGYPEATFRDRLSYLRVLHALDQSNFATTLTELQNESMNSPTKMTELLAWMSDNQLALLAIHWSKQLPNDVVTKRPVPAAVADCYVTVNDWDGLREWCQKKNWQDLEFLRHAFLSRAAREKGDQVLAQSEWNSALETARSDGERLFALEQNVVKWGWKKEAENILWMLATYQNRQFSALAALYEYYKENGDTANLYRAAARLSELRPRDDALQNNLAQVALLLKMDVDHANKSAEHLYQANPKSPVYSSTYAFSLYRQGKFSQAAKIMSQLGEEDLKKPAFAAYYGIFLAAAGNKELAREFLGIGRQGDLLPEEKALVEKAQQ